VTAPAATGGVLFPSPTAKGVAGAIAIAAGLAYGTIAMRSEHKLAQAQRDLRATRDAAMAGIAAARVSPADAARIAAARPGRSP
jgi:hypothetical protein